MPLFANVLRWIKGVYNKAVRMGSRFLELDPEDLKKQEIWNEAVRHSPWQLGYVPDHLITEEMCNEAVRNNPYTLQYVPDHLKTQGMCKGAMHVNPALFFLVPDYLKTEEMCEGAAEIVKIWSWQLGDVPDRFKTRDMRKKAVEKDPRMLKYIPYWFVIRELVTMWHDYDDHCNDDKFIEWYEGYKKRRAQRVKIEKELISIAWHPSRCWNWYVPEDEKKETEKLWK